MGVTVSCPLSDYSDLDTIFGRSLSFSDKDARTALAFRSFSFNGRDSEPADVVKQFGSGKITFPGSLSFKDREGSTVFSVKPPRSVRGNNNKFVKSGIKSLDHKLPKSDENHRNLAALKVQKVYKSFRTRRQLADCAVLVEQRWWKLLDFAELKRSSISFFDIEKPETAVSRWSRARTRAAKVGKGLSKDEKARKLALKHWLEAIDPRHRYGHNLQFYYATWLHCESKQPFFYWLDVGEGKEVNLVDRCPRSKLQQQCIKYLGPTERKAYEVLVENRKFFYKQTMEVIDTTGGPTDAKWIFVLSTSKTLYVAQKRKGTFQHSSFLAGGATLSAGRVVIEQGVLKAVWPHSGHYLPTAENFEELMTYLEDHNIDLASIQKCSTDVEDTRRGKIRSNASEPDQSEKNNDLGGAENSDPPISKLFKELGSKLTKLEIPRKVNMFEILKKEEQEAGSSPPHTPSDGYETADEFLPDEDFVKPNLFDEDQEDKFEEIIPADEIILRINAHKRTRSFQLAQQLSCKWTTGAGPRIGCVRDYPSELQFRTLEKMCLSPTASHVSPRMTPRNSSKVSVSSLLCRETSAGTSPFPSPHHVSDNNPRHEIG
ncbi:hypothetical protein RJ641_027351 [Dillenia turbinata]|uniref:IQ domain-containing protein IQM6 n=1 Tax=Dillenia turbinata TaxID=194707 RepID=A0AAN8W2A3_9MAGN